MEGDGCQRTIHTASSPDGSLETRAPKGSRDGIQEVRPAHHRPPAPVATPPTASSPAQARVPMVASSPGATAILRKAMAGEATAGQATERRDTGLVNREDLEDPEGLVVQESPVVAVAPERV